MAVRTWVGRFCVAGGHLSEEGPWLGSLIRQRPDEEADELYLVIEPASPASATYTGQLVDVIARLYHNDPLSLTGALTRALRAAHEHLSDWNRKSLKEHRVGAGAGCLALRGSEAYLAQVGPGVAYLRTADGEFRRIAPQAPGFDHALGVADDFDPHLTRLPLNPGDLLLVATTAIDGVIPQHHLERILARGADDALPELYLLCRDIPEFALVLLSCFEPEPSQPPGFLTRDGAFIEQATAPLDDGPAPAAQGVLVGAPAASGPPLAEASLAGALGRIDLPRRPAHEQVREITESTAPLPPTGVRLRGESATPSYRRTTGPVSMPRLRVPKLAVFALLALTVLGLLAWWQLPGSVKQSREDKFTALVATAREDNARAQATEDKGARRQLLTDARTKLTDAAKIHKDDAAVLQLQSDVTDGLKSLDNITDIREFTTVADLQQLVTGSLTVTNSVVGGGNAFFLDARGKRVIRVPLDASTPPETIAQEGGFGGVITLGRPVQIAWSADAQTLIIFDDRRQGFAYAGGALLPLTVRDTAGIGSLDAVNIGGKNLYVLDVKNDQVWRYLPGQGGYDSERAALLDSVSLENATEIAVGEDVYVLDQKLGIRRFVDKVEAPFPLAGINTPLVSPASLSVLPGSNRIIVADRGNKRIVVASPQGNFMTQIVSPTFTDLRAVAMDEGTRTLYVLNGNTLLKAPYTQ